jgi:hypothetical protein
MQPPRAPASPARPAAPRPPRLALSRWRDADSAGLDGRAVRPRGEEEQPVPEFVRWPEFYAFLDDHWAAGEHLSVVAMTGSGKTTFVREVIGIRGYVVIIANKQMDDSLYPPMHPTLKAQGFIATDQFNPRDLDHPKVVFYCPLTSNTPEAEVHQREQMRKALRDLYVIPGWTVVIDEVAYLSKDLKLDRELNALWREGRSKGTTVIAGTQRPVNVPRNMWEMATHLALFRMSGKEDRDTATGYLGDYQGVANETVRLLPKYELLYVDKVEAIAMRTKVEP